MPSRRQCCICLKDGKFDCCHHAGRAVYDAIHASVFESWLLGAGTMNCAIKSKENPHISLSVPITFKSCFKV
jgi:hypothetical protein